MSILYWFYLLLGLSTVNLLVEYMMIQSLLSKSPDIATTVDLDRFKNLARLNMYAALLQIVILGSGEFLGFYGQITGGIGLLLFLFLNAVIIVISKVVKKSEKLSQNLPVRDPLLSNEYQAVCDTWNNNLFPNF